MQLRNPRFVLALLAAAVVIVAAAEVHSSFIRTAEVALEPGQGVAAPVLPSGSSSLPTLILALRADCPFCQASMPFYRQLADTRRAGKLRVNLLVVEPDGPTTADQYLRANRLDIPFRSGFDLGALGVTGTPTLMLLGPSQTVLGVWRGQLPPGLERELMADFSRAQNKPVLEH